MGEPDARTTVLAGDGRRPLWVMPQEPGSRSDRAALPVLDDPQSAPAAAFRLLRHQLRAAGDPRVMAVASPCDASTAARCAVQVALAYAEFDPSPILLLEADVTHPRLAALLGMTVSDCFALQLYDRYDGSDEPWRGMSATPPNLHVLAVSPTAAASDRVPVRELSQALSELVRQPHAHIVVACPPVLGAATVNLISESCDGVLLTGRTRHVRAEQLKDAAAQLAPARVLGAALLA